MAKLVDTWGHFHRTLSISFSILLNVLIHDVASWHYNLDNIFTKKVTREFTSFLKSGSWTWKLIPQFLSRALKHCSSKKRIWSKVIAHTKFKIRKWPLQPDISWRVNLKTSFSLSHTGMWQTKLEENWFTCPPVNSLPPNASRNDRKSKQGKFLAHSWQGVKKKLHTCRMVSTLESSVWQVLKYASNWEFLLAQPYIPKERQIYNTYS